VSGIVTGVAHVNIIKVVELKFETDYGYTVVHEKKRYKTAAAAATAWSDYRTGILTEKKFGPYEKWPADGIVDTWQTMVQKKLYRRALPIFERILA
jgi:hypothetical protein